MKGKNRTLLGYYKYSPSNDPEEQNSRLLRSESS